MNPSHPLLMIPGPVEISARVAEAAAQRPLGHLDPEFVAAFGGALRALRAVWRASDNASPFVVPGGGTLAMESAATNVVAPGERALVVVTGYFGDRMAEMLRRRGAGVETVEASPGEAPAPDEVAAALARGRDAFANMRPVASATNRIPVADSMVTMRCAKSPTISASAFSASAYRPSGPVPKRR